MKSSFGPEFKVTEVPMTGIDPKMLAAQKLPDGLKFEPGRLREVRRRTAVPGRDQRQHDRASPPRAPATGSSPSRWRPRSRSR